MHYYRHTSSPVAFICVCACFIIIYLEVDKDFTFISDEYRVQVGNHKFFVDLLITENYLD